MLKILLLLLCLPLHAAAELSMLWLTDHDMHKDSHRNQSAVDVNGSTLAVLRQQLPQLSIHTEVVNTARALLLLKSEPNACTGNKILSEARLQHAVASQLPQVVFPGLRLFALSGSDTAALLEKLKDAQGRVSVRQLLNEHKNARFAIAGGRNYGKQLQRLINEPQHQKRFWQRHSSDLAMGVIQMLQSGRVELLIEYPNVVAHNLVNQQQQTQVVSVAVAESPAMLLGHILCAKTPQGRELLTLLEQQLAVVSKTEAYLQAHLQWFEASSHAEVTRLYNEVYGTAF